MSREVTKAMKADQSTLNSPARECAGRTPSVLDLAHLRRYTLGDVHLEQELLGLFREQARTQFDLAAATDDAATFKLAIHTLKGTARSIGALEVSNASEALEPLNANPVLARSSPQMIRLRAAIVAVEQAISQMNA